MPVDQIDWPTVAVSPDGTAMIVRKLGGRRIPIDAGAIRCMVDEDYAARTKAAVDAMQLTREELRALLEVSTPPPGWEDDPA